MAGRGRTPGESPAEAKARFLNFLREGMSIEQAIKAAGRTRSTYEVWRKSDKEFVSAVERIRLMRATARHEPGEEMSFADFSKKYLDAEVFPHAMNIIDMIEHRQPAWMHPAFTFEQGEDDMVMVNMPPSHGKSTTITVNYVTYRIAMNPNIRVIIVSKTAEKAQEFLYSIKERLTNPKYADMIAKYAPPGGFDKDSNAWNAKKIWINPEIRNSGEKDPTVQTLGIRGQIVGSRAELIILDDCIDFTNAHEYEKQIRWIQGEVQSRIEDGGSLLIVGTRMSSKDMYSELRDPKRYEDEVQPWTYLAMPAVLNFADSPEDWETLWPRSNQPPVLAKGAELEPGPDGYFPKWGGRELMKKRKKLTPRAWALVYQQSQVHDEGIFDGDAVSGCINGNRTTGRIPKGMHGNRPNGMDGLLIVAGLDPATTGHTAAVVMGLDVQSQKRYVLDVYNKAGTTPTEMRDLIKDWTLHYAITEWRIEKNGFQGFLVHDKELNDFCNSRGVLIRPHFTGNNKHNEEFGVASMAMLFNYWKEGNALIELPSTQFSEAMKEMVLQLVTWAPDLPKGTKTDIVMAMWFAELACKDRVAQSGTYRTHMENPYLTRWDKQQQNTVNLLDLWDMNGPDAVGF